MYILKSKTGAYTLLYIRNKLSYTKSTKQKKDMAGLYIHIPFCKSRCIYCGFYSTTSSDMKDTYVDALCREMEMRPVEAASVKDAAIETVYIGGGTPSQLTGIQLMKIFDQIERIYLSKQEARPREVTLECNPDDVTDTFCDILRQLPVNRISMGAQTFDNERLRFLHRRHHAEDVAKAVERLKQAGIYNISIDLMFGFPAESMEEWQRDIKEAISLDVEHISAYSLMYEEGTPLYRLLEAGRVKETDEETYRQMYETLIDLLTDAGYEHYEISNFAKPGCRSIHNSSYWQDIPYIGLGAAAHSYTKGTKTTRSWNIDNIGQYTESIGKGEFPSEAEVLDTRTRYNDLITTSLRTCDGIELAKLKSNFGESYFLKTISEAKKHMERGTMQIKEGHLSLTRNGLFISDDIMSDFMMV